MHGKNRWFFTVRQFFLPPHDRGLEIRAFEQRVHVQAIKPEATLKFIASGRNTLVASTNGTVFKLEPSPYDRQVQDCIQSKQFELALNIAVSLMCMCQL